MDRLYYCLQYLDLDEIPGLEDESFKGNFEDVDLIIDCTEVFIERPSETIAQSATWSEYKEHSTGILASVSFWPLLIIEFVARVSQHVLSTHDLLVNQV